jgi:hypothetical protein
MNTSKAWLVVGHGSVGSWLAERIAPTTDRLFVIDPAPRVPVRAGRLLDAQQPTASPVDFVISCVPPAQAEEVTKTISGSVSSSTVLFDWNSASPEVKARIAAQAPCMVVDVALLDSVDGNNGQPLLAISGPRAGDQAEELRRLGFLVDVVGDKCGDAALLKFVRSAFMKGLEGLLLEYYSLASSLDPSGVVTLSITRNLGEQFTAFAQVLLKTNRLHARRRARELLEAAEVLSRGNGSMLIAHAAIATLERSARAWDMSDAPAEDASVGELMAFFKGVG